MSIAGIDEQNSDTKSITKTAGIAYDLFDMLNSVMPM